MNETKHNLASRMLKSSSLYASSGVLRNIVGFLMLPVYTRYLSPEDYGIVALMVFAVSMIEITVGARLGHAPQKYYHDQKTEEERKRVISTALIITSSFSAVVTLLAIAFSEQIAVLLYDSNELTPVVSLFLILIITQAIESIGFIYIRILNKAMLYFWLSLIKLVFQLSANILCIVIWELGVLGMATATAFSAVLFGGIILLYLVRTAGLGINKTLGIKMLLFTLPLWLSGLVSLYIGSSNRFWMKHFASLEDIGFYSLAERLAAIVGALLFEPFYSYWSAERFRLKDRPDFDSIHRTVFIFVYLILIAFALGISTYGQFIVGIFADKSFWSAHKALPILALASIFYSLSQFYQFSFLHREKTKIISRIMNITAIFSTILNIMLIPIWGFVGAAAALACSYFFILLLSEYLARPLYDMKLPLKKCFFTILIAIIGFSVGHIAELDPFTVKGFLLLGINYLVTLIAIISFNIDKTTYTTIRTFIAQKRKTAQ